MKSRTFFVLLLCLQAVVLASEEWSYSNTDKWKEIEGSMCGALAQSPINLDESSAEFIGDINAAVRIIDTATSQKTFTVENNGHSVVVNIPEKTWAMTLNNDSVNRYEVAQYHFHWGANSESGSEHNIDDKTYPLEMHIVAFDSTLYKSFAEAKNRPKGLAVIGVFFAVSDNDEYLKQQGRFLDELPKVTAPGANATIEAFMPTFMLPKSDGKYFRYYGSLTTPDCTENVQWTVMTDPLSVSEAQLKLFRSLKFADGSPMVNNFRPVLPLNPKGIAQPRVLYKSWNASSYIHVSLIVILISIFFSMK